MVTVDVNIRGLGKASYLYEITTPKEVIPGTIGTGLETLILFLALKLGKEGFTHVRLSSNSLLYRTRDQPATRIEGYQVPPKTLFHIAEKIRELNPNQIVTYH